MSIDTFYLLAATALLFGAGFFAARKVFPDLAAKQFALIGLISVLMVGLIWMLLTMVNRKHEEVPLSPANQQVPPLQPNQD